MIGITGTDTVIGPGWRNVLILSGDLKRKDPSPSILLLAFVKIAVVLDARDPQALHARTIDGALP